MKCDYCDSESVAESEGPAWIFKADAEKAGNETENMNKGLPMYLCEKHLEEYEKENP